MIGDAGRTATYCIQENESISPNFFNALSACFGINDTALGRTHLCTLNEWYTACTADIGILNMRNNTEMIAQTNGTTNYITVGGLNCNTFSTDHVNGAWLYRCCIK